MYCHYKSVIRSLMDKNSTYLLFNQLVQNMTSNYTGISDVINTMKTELIVALVSICLLVLFKLKSILLRCLGMDHNVQHINAATIENPSPSTTTTTHRSYGRRFSDFIMTPIRAHYNRSNHHPKKEQSNQYEYDYDDTKNNTPLPTPSHSTIYDSKSIDPIEPYVNTQKHTEI